MRFRVEEGGVLQDIVHYGVFHGSSWLVVENLDGNALLLIITPAASISRRLNERRDSLYPFGFKYPYDRYPTHLSCMRFCTGLSPAESVIPEWMHDSLVMQLGYYSNSRQYVIVHPYWMPERQVDSAWDFCRVPLEGIRSFCASAAEYLCGQLVKF